MSRTARISKPIGIRQSTTATSPRPKSKLATSQRAKSFSQVDSNEFPDERPAKRQRLEIRGPKQQTLDNFFGPNALKPPIKIAQQQPNGPLVETINGVRNEMVVTTNGDTTTLDGAGPQPSKKIKTLQPQKQEERRSLRSQDDGPRLKSGLAIYFANYEDIMFDVPREKEFIDIESTLYIADDAPQAKQGKAVTPSPSKSIRSIKETPKSKLVPRSPPRTQSQFDLKPTEVDLSSIMKNIRDDVEDPLTDDVYMVSHRRAERKEKQMRNIEGEHAMHEKVQLERLLEGLQGHDWLKVLGVTGVTDGEAKKFEKKRDYFISEVQMLIDKFNNWKEEERRRKLEREAMLAAERELEEAPDEDDEVSSATSSGPGSSDLNMSASKQLQQEAAMAFARDKKKAKAPPLPAVPYRPPSPIKSFYPSKHLRESALKKTRNSRNILAFGLPLPETEEREFELPAGLITQDVLNASARERRRRQRENVSNATTNGSRA